VQVHARKAWLKGLSPKENRNIPPLQHELVWRLKARRPGMWVATNGGIRTIEEARHHLTHVDGVMIGRAVAEDLSFLADVERDLLGHSGWSVDPIELSREVLGYALEQESLGVPATRVVRHLLPLFTGRPGARRWRQMLSSADRGTEALRAAIASFSTSDLVQA
jgi:tRNA-dihydrouridine synthase A